MQQTRLPNLSCLSHGICIKPRIIFTNLYMGKLQLQKVQWTLELPPWWLPRVCSIGGVQKETPPWRPGPKGCNLSSKLNKRKPGLHKAQKEGLAVQILAHWLEGSIFLENSPGLPCVCSLILSSVCDLKTLKEMTCYKVAPWGGGRTQVQTRKNSTDFQGKQVTAAKKEWVKGPCFCPDLPPLKAAGSSVPTLHSQQVPSEHAFLLSCLLMLIPLLTDSFILLPVASTSLSPSLTPAHISSLSS